MATELEQLEARLAELKAEREQPVSGDVVDGEGGVYLIIADEKFECRRVSVTWQMMQFAEAQRKANTNIPRLPEDHPKVIEAHRIRNEAGMEMMSTMLKTIRVLLKPYERTRFEEFMDTLSQSEEGIEPGALESAIGEVIAAVGGQAGKGKAEQNTAVQSSVSSQTTNENVRVISFNKVTPEDALPDKK